MRRCSAWRSICLRSANTAASIAIGSTARLNGRYRHSPTSPSGRPRYTFGLQLGESGGIARRLVSVDDLGLFPILQPPESLGQETLCRRRVPRRREIEIDRVAQLVDRAVEVIYNPIKRRARRPSSSAYLSIMFWWTFSISTRCLVSAESSF